jgi:transcriptional regulator with XRE-family HTH domain
VSEHKPLGEMTDEEYEAEFNAALGRNIRQARTAKKLSRRGLAKLAGISERALVDYERAKRKLGISGLQQIADALAITAISLLPKL